MPHGHGHNHGQSHDHTSTNIKVLIIALVLALSFSAIEATFGWLANSLALLSDAGHMAADSFSLSDFGTSILSFGNSVHAGAAVRGSRRRAAPTRPTGVAAR